MAQDTNIILIGMPGAGKSTIGKQLAEHTGLHFIDTDLLIEAHDGCPLQQVFDTRGNDAFRALEEEILLDLALDHNIVSTGGSVVYSDAAMQHLKTQGLVVFLDVALEILDQRVNSQGPRGIALEPGQTFKDLYEERIPLYKKYADIIYNNEKPVNAADLHQHIDAFTKI